MTYVDYKEYQEFIDAFYGNVYLDVEISEDGKNKLIKIDSGVRRGCIIATIEDYANCPAHHIDKSWLD